MAGQPIWNLSFISKTWENKWKLVLRMKCIFFSINLRGLKCAGRNVLDPEINPEKRLSSYISGSNWEYFGKINTLGALEPWKLHLEKPRLKISLYFFSSAFSNRKKGGGDPRMNICYTLICYTLLCSYRTKTDQSFCKMRAAEFAITKYTLGRGLLIIWSWLFLRNKILRKQLRPAP